MTTYWLLGEREQVASQPDIIGSDRNMSSQIEIGAISSPGITDEQNPHFTSQDTPSIAPESVRKTHFVENVSETEEKTLDSNKRSSKNSNPSDSLLSSESSHPSHHHNHPPAHIISNPMTSMDEEDKETGGKSSASFQQQISTHR